MDALQVVDGHLGGAMAGNMGGHLAAQLQNAQILDDKGVHLRPGRAPDQLCQLVHLPVRHDGIHRQMDLDAPDMAVLYRLRQVFQCKVFRALAGVEDPDPQIHRVGAVLHGSPQRFHGAGGS